MLPLLGKRVTTTILNSKTPILTYHRLQLQKMAKRRRTVASRPRRRVIRRPSKRRRRNTTAFRRRRRVRKPSRKRVKVPVSFIRRRRRTKTFPSKIQQIYSEGFV